MSGDAPSHRGLVIAGFVFVALTVVVPPLGIVAIVIGTVLLARERTGPGLAILLLGVFVPVLSFLLYSALFKPYRIPSAAMEPTVRIGDRILVDRAGFSDPGRGDIVVFAPPAGAEANECGVPGFEPAARNQVCPRPTPGEANQSFIKRIVAVGGDRVRIEHGRVVLNGRPAEEPYIEPSEDCDVCNLPREIEVPAGHFLMLGDNRGESADSRHWGPVPEDSVTGKVILRYWPLGRVGSP